MDAIIRTTRAGALLAAALLAAGCGGGGKPPTVPVAGKVMFKKTTPAADALVTFHPTDPALAKRIGGVPFAKVRADGTFALTSFAPDDGAPEGEYGVTVEWRGKAKEGKPSLGIEGGAVGGSGSQLLTNPKYGDPSKPAFTVTVKKGQPNEFTFDVD
jgi:hypothetical protein